MYPDSNVDTNDNIGDLVTDIDTNTDNKLNIKHLVFSGCGSKIFLFVGVLKYLFENDLINNVHTIIGTSGGALISFFLVLGYDFDSILELFLEITIKPILDFDIDDFLQLFDKFGINDIDEYRRILGIVLNAKYGTYSISFIELYKLTNKHLIICSTNISRHRAEFFSYKTHPDMDVIKAIEMSMCIPFLFKPINFNNEYYVDGSITSHYPIEFLDATQIKSTLGILVAMDNYICKDNIDNTNTLLKHHCELLKEKTEIKSFSNFLFSVLFSPVIKLIQECYKEYNDNTILIINNRNGFDFNITKDERTQLINEGYESCRHFFIHKSNIYEYNKIKETNYNLDIPKTKDNSKEITSKEINSKEITSKEITSKEITSKEITSKEITSKVIIPN